jgi:hypothetical protein
MEMEHSNVLLVLIVHGSRKDFISRIMMNSVTPVRYISLYLVPILSCRGKALILDVGSSVYDDCCANYICDGTFVCYSIEHILASLGSFTALGDLLRGRADRSKHTQRVVMHWRSYRLLFAQQVGFIMVDPVSH